jgi:hypothetical protein
MSPGSVETLAICVMVAVVMVTWIIVRQVGNLRHSRVALNAGKEYQGLADEYRRLSDMAITAQEHTDLRLTEISVRIDALRTQLEQMQSILSEVE